MLRTVIAAIGALALCAGIVLAFVPPHAGWGLLIFGALVLLSLLFEGRYRGSIAASANASHLEPTGEKFIDPGTGQLLEVYYDPKTGAREYRPDETSGAVRRKESE